MANFRIIEGYDNYYDKYKLFVEAYNKGINVRKIRDNLGLTSHRYQQYKKEALEEGKIKPRRDMKNPKYYTKTANGNYIIAKRDAETMKMISYGTYHTLEETLQIIEKLKKNNWKKL